MDKIDLSKMTYQELDNQQRAWINEYHGWVENLVITMYQAGSTVFGVERRHNYFEIMAGDTLLHCYVKPLTYNEGYVYQYYLIVTCGVTELARLNLQGNLDEGYVRVQDDDPTTVTMYITPGDWMTAADAYVSTVENAQAAALAAAAEQKRRDLLKLLSK